MFFIFKTGQVSSSSLLDKVDIILKDLKLYFSSIVLANMKITLFFVIDAHTNQLFRKVTLEEVHYIWIEKRLKVRRYQEIDQELKS